MDPLEGIAWKGPPWWGIPGGDHLCLTTWSSSSVLDTWVVQPVWGRLEGTARGNSACDTLDGTRSSGPHGWDPLDGERLECTPCWDSLRGTRVVDRLERNPWK
jgi:hypothetical protein